MILERLRQALWQVPLLMVIAGLIALGANQWRSDGIALIGDWSAEARFADAVGNSLVVDLDEAAGLFEGDAAIFLDARPPGQYDEGYIQGALNLPWQEADRYFMELAERLDDARTIITYCDGESCDLSHELALFLQQMGFGDVRVLVNGWTVWRQAGLLTEAGE